MLASARDFRGADSPGGHAGAGRARSRTGARDFKIFRNPRTRALYTWYTGTVPRRTHVHASTVTPRLRVLPHHDRALVLERKRARAQAVVGTMEAVRAFRKLSPLITQRWVADALGVDVNTVARWERGEGAAGSVPMLRLALEALRSRAEAFVAAKVVEAMTR